MNFMKEFGLTVDEVLKLTSVAESAAQTADAKLSREVLNRASPETTERIRESLVSGSFKTLSKVGFDSLVLLQRDNPKEFQSLESVLNRILVDPVQHRSVATWCLYFALHECSARFQLIHCPSPSHEAVLSGMLLGEISAQCEVWARKAAAPLDRLKTTLSLERIDLSILGGEQKTGGDFGLVVEFDDSRTEPPAKHEPRGTRIVPLIFQAKRYVGQVADISQNHRIRGFQRDLLSRNKCLSAYIFFQNGNERLEMPMPPLIKPVPEDCRLPSRTKVFVDSLDLPTYLLRALYDDSLAPGASSPLEALEMIYASANSGQLARLAVISSTTGASLRYNSALEEISRMRGELQEPENGEEPPTP